jgi:UTP--glucose-1-phosphate uridylyltransferase
MKAVIPAAGLGTRFLPYTKAQPKEMIPVVDKPAIQYVVEEAADAGITDILIVTGRGKRAIEDHFDASPEFEGHFGISERNSSLEDLSRVLKKVRIMYVRQSIPRGLGDAVLQAESFVGTESFAVLLGDDLTFDPPCMGYLLGVHQRLRAPVVALQKVPSDHVGRYGIATGTEVEAGVFRLTALVEKPSPSEVRSDLATIGRYVLAPTIFRYLRAIAPGKGSELQLSDAIAGQLRQEPVYGVVYPGRRYDVGDKVGWLRATFDLALRRPDLRDSLRGMGTANRS